MQEIFNFLKANWQLAVAVITFIFSVVIAFIRKRPVESIVTAIFYASIEAVKVAEASNLKGLDKLKYCVGLINKSLETSFPGINVSSYYGLICQIIEDILTTPQKKER